MRALVLFRHGKSDWGADPGGEDLARRLAPRGERAARTMGRFLKLAGQVPEAALSSPAVRARETLRLAMEAGGWSCPAEEREGLLGGPEQVVEELRRAPAECKLLLAVGHEPTWSALASLLIGGGSLRLPTAALARIDLQLEEWRTLGPGSGQLTWLVVPRLFPKGRFEFSG